LGRLQPDRQSFLVIKTMVTRRTNSAKAQPASGPAITFGHLILLIGICGILFNVSIDFKGSTKPFQQDGTFIKEAADVEGMAGGARVLEHATTVKDPFQLTVPFYVYEDRDLNWEDATLNGEPYEPAAPSAGGCGTFPAHFLERDRTC
jgi:hypothetical protein